MNIMDEARRITAAYLGRAQATEVKTGLFVSTRPSESVFVTRPRTLIDEYGDTTVVQPEPEYVCQCGTREQPYFDAACPQHGEFCGLKSAALARLHAGEKR